MKPSSPRPPRKPVNRATARNSLLVNQFATPGLGSLMAGRWIEGMGQILLAFAGFALVVAWFIAVMNEYYGQISGDVQPRSVAWLGETGGIVFIAAWLWALVTSISLLREARRNETAQLQNGVA